jgi:DNA-directed RNA polymerase subunit RPC12/RpoP
MKCDGCEAQISKPIPVLFRNGHLEVECPNCGFEIDVTDRIFYTATMNSHQQQGDDDGNRIKG